MTITGTTGSGSHGRPGARAVPCPGGCNAAWRRAWRDHETALAAYQKALAEWSALPVDGRGERPQRPPEPTTEPIHGDPTWCSRCVAAIRSALAELDDLAAVLSATDDGYRPDSRLTARVSGTAGSPTPSPVVDMLDDLYSVLTAAEDWVRAARNYPPRPRRTGRGVHARTACIAWLMGELPVVLALPDSVSFGQGVFEWRGRLRAATSSAPERSAQPGRCPRCEQRALRPRGDGYVECARCGRLLSPQEYQTLGGAA